MREGEGGREGEEDSYSPEEIFLFMTSALSGV